MGGENCNIDWIELFWHLYTDIYTSSFFHLQVLTDDNLDQLDKLYQAISPSREDCEDYPQKLNLAADHLVNILDGKDRQVMGTTYKELKELITLINECGYFERAPKSETEGILCKLVTASWCDECGACVLRNIWFICSCNSHTQ